MNYTIKRLTIFMLATTLFTLPAFSMKRVKFKVGKSKKVKSELSIEQNQNGGEQGEVAAAAPQEPQTTLINVATSNAATVAATASGATTTNTVPDASANAETTASDTTDAAHDSQQQVESAAAVAQDAFVEADNFVRNQIDHLANVPWTRPMQWNAADIMRVVLLMASIGAGAYCGGQMF